MSINARQDAFDRVGGRFDARVLEPSPPAVDDPSWFADDPVAAEPRQAGLALLSPVGNGDLTWDRLAADEPDLDLGSWCGDRWLGAWRRLPALPSGSDTLSATREALHAVAENVLAPARRRANGKIGLRYTAGGFGTPFFRSEGDGGVGEQVRVEGFDVVVVRKGREERAPVTTLAAAGQLVGIEPGPPADLYKPATMLDLEATLAVDHDAARLFGDWFGFACSVLEELRASTGAIDRRTQLWPEHFDLSIDFGEEASGTRGTFGASPGDAAHPAPYLYVTHWKEHLPADPFWGETAFTGASLVYATLLDVDDQRATALDFFRTGLTVLGISDG
jgi:hypothetical protein